MMYLYLYFWRLIQVFWATALFSVFFSFLTHNISDIVSGVGVCETDGCLVNSFFIVGVPIFVLGYLFIFNPIVNQGFIEKIKTAFIYWPLTATNLLYSLAWVLIVFLIYLGTSLSFLFGIPFGIKMLLLNLDFSDTQVYLITFISLIINLAIIGFWNERKRDFMNWPFIILGMYRRFWPEALITGKSRLDNLFAKKSS